MTGKEVLTLKISPKATIRDFLKQKLLEEYEVNSDFWLPLRNALSGVVADTSEIDTAVFAAIEEM